MKIELNIVAKLLWDNESFQLLCHSHPDGDTLGSASALAHALKAMGKKVCLWCADEVAPCFGFMLEGLDFTISDDPAFVIAVDVADPKLLGDEGNRIFGDKVDLCIDHHGSNLGYAAGTWLRADSASTAEMIYLLLKEMGCDFTPQMASCLFTGVSTDTGCFRFSNTTPQTHRIAADLIELGADSAEIIRVFFETKSRAYAALEKLALSEMTMYLGGRVAVMTVTRAMFGKSGAKQSDTDRLANLPRQIEGVQVGVTMKEQEDGTFKASVRTFGDVDASAICARLGGGGHKGAAGCTIAMPRSQAVNVLVDEIAKELK